VRVTVTNTGTRAGDEVLQLYLSHEEASVPVPICQLAGFKRVHLAAGASTVVDFPLAPRQFSLIDDAGRRVVEPGAFHVVVGGCQPGYEALVAGCTGTVGAGVQVTGERVVL